MESPDPQSILNLLPFAVALGIELLEADPDQVRGRLTWAPDRTTTGDVMHGGALMALADTCGGVCAFLNLPPEAHATASTRPLHRGRRLIVLETEIARDDGKLAAKVTQTQVFHYGD